MVYNTTEEAIAAEQSVRSHPLHGKRMFARLYRPMKPAARNPHIDPNKPITIDDVDFVVSKRIRETVDATNITAFLRPEKPKHDYIDYETGLVPQVTPAPCKRRKRRRRKHVNEEEQYRVIG